MPAAIFDLEGDGLVPTKIHVVSVNVGGKKKSLTNYDDMRKFFLNAKTLVGHNIVLFDIPVVERILQIKVKARLIDTLPLSWYLYPKKLVHGLDAWGKELGVDKPPIDDWDNLPLEEYIHRCEEDVEITRLLWEKLRKELIHLYEGKKEADRFLRYLEFKMTCARKQEELGWKLDVEKVEQLLAKLEPMIEEKKAELLKAMPKVPVIKKKTRPAKPFKKDGTLSATGAKWFNLLAKKGLPENYRGVVEVVDGYVDPNPSSHIQKKDWLYSLGWEPITFKYDRDKTTNEVKKIPQIKSLDEDGELCDSVKELAEKEPAILVLQGLGILEHRVSVLKGFRDNVGADGRIKAQVAGLTNTLRFKHKTIVNLPGVNKPYGKEIRGCLIASEGHKLIGSDQAALEDRTKQHYMYDYDPEYVEEMKKPGFDPHLDLAFLAKALTREQIEKHKRKEEDHSGLRHVYKTTNYTCTYGATPPTIARAAKTSLEEGERLHRIYWERNWSILKIAEDQVVKTVKGQKWLFNPVSKFWYSLRFEKDRFSTLNQGTGVFCFDTWVREVTKFELWPVGQFHDEIILDSPEEKVEEHKEILLIAVGKTNNKLKLNRELDVGIQDGYTYADIH